jgi:hypothetical protein
LDGRLPSIDAMGMAAFATFAAAGIAALALKRFEKCMIFYL